MRLNRRAFVQAAAGGVGALVTGRSLSGMHLLATEEVVIDEKTTAALALGHRFLVSRQQDDGAFGASGYRGNVGVCGLAGMALMAAGSTPGRGPHGQAVTRFLSYIATAAQESGFINISATASHGPMYDHGFATLFLAECYGMSSRNDLRDKLAKAVKLIIQTQNAEGGWRYPPQRDEADISVTVCQIMALRAARNGGVYVPAETIEKAVAYVRQCQNPDGGFMYRLPAGESAFPRSAAAIVALNSAGIYDSTEVRKALDYIETYRPAADRQPRVLQNYLYGHYYAAQAMWAAGGERWRRWYEAVRDDLLARQKSDGSWYDPYGAEYATAMACLVLQMPNNYLPIFQR